MAYIPFFSIVIPIYNGSSTIKSTLNSLTFQEYSSFEVILIDDGSEDIQKTEAIVKQYSQKLDIHLIKHPSNKNGAAARNTGISCAKGQYIAFLDADDQWKPTKLKVIKEEIKAQSRNPNELVFFSQIIIKSAKGEAIVPEYFSSAIPMSEYIFMRGGVIQTSSIVVSKELAKKIKFDARFKRHQDYDFVLRASHLDIPFVFIEEPLVIYNVPNKIFSPNKESAEYSLWWAKEMQRFFTRKALGAFYMMNIFSRFFFSKQYYSALKFFLKGGAMLGPLGLFESSHKIKRVLKRFLSQ